MPTLKVEIEMPDPMFEWLKNNSNRWAEESGIPEEAFITDFQNYKLKWGYTEPITLLTELLYHQMQQNQINLKLKQNEDNKRTVHGT